MSNTKLNVTNFSNRTGSPFKPKESEEIKIVHEEVLQKSHYDQQKEKQNELLQRVNKKTAEYQAGKPSSGVFTEVVTHGAFTVKNNGKEKTKTETVSSVNPTPCKGNGVTGSKSLLGFPSSANDLALDAKSDLESDPNISKEMKDKVIEKLFALVSMVQHVYESKVRIMTEFDKFKEVHLKNETRRERDHAEQLYKLNMNFQNEVVQSIQRLKSELDISRSVSNRIEGRCQKEDPIDFHTSDDSRESYDTADKNNVEEQELKENNELKSENAYCE